MKQNNVSFKINEDVPFNINTKMKCFTKKDLNKDGDPLIKKKKILLAKLRPKSIQVREKRPLSTNHYSRGNSDYILESRESISSLSKS